MKQILCGSKPLPAMTIGTVQLGMNYGIANFDGKPSEEKSFAMLRAAFESGVLSMDTARAYGNSEEVIGAFLKTWEGPMPYITTKVRRMNDPEGDIEAHAIRSVEESLQRLGVKKVDCILLHNPVDLYQHGPKLEQAMKRLVELGYTDRIGISVYTREDVDEMLKYPAYSATQVPMSIFDQRLIADGTVERLKERGYTVFVRSVFLQGVFFLDPDKITDPILLEHAAPRIRLIREIAAEEGMTVAQLAIAFMRDTPGVTSLVLGADTPEQVKENVSYFDVPALAPAVRERLEREFQEVDIPEIMKVLSRPKPQN
ncbi:MAG: aldo/keto reductase [Clostridia bacterium]|nr:aldo/keto reductase [Clostridia bacterium]